ncbi:MAG: hypothetical protein Q4B05_00310 [Candidatus Saccharibacteria bacterium]|nr:hypothetical protein [Candidatus Saccharibacteria bacterium]
MIDTSKFMITTRLLVEEAIRKGYSISTMVSRPSAKSYAIRCEKGGKVFYFKGLCTALSPSYAVFMANDKVLTRDVLGCHGVPMPATTVVSLSDSAYEATDKIVSFLREHGRLVVKPAMANHGRGITVDVRDEDDLRKAIDMAYREDNSPDIVVQQMVFGREYRFLVLNGEVLAVAYRRPAFVAGNGKSTIRELIEEKNLDPRRGEGHSAALTKINIEHVVNSNPRGFLDDIPDAGVEVDVLQTSNLSRGGESIDVTDQVSIGLKDIAIRAAQACSLGIAGVDIITEDITTGDDSNSYVLEVNASPGIRMHQFPSVGTPRDVARELFAAIEKTAQPLE